MSKLSETVAKICLGLASIVVALILCEIASRYLYHIEIAHFVNCKGKLTDIRLDDPELGWRLKPNFCGKQVGSEFQTSVRTNSSGFRDNKEFVKEKGNQYRILGLGDSITFGWGVEQNQTYLNLVESELQRSLGRPVQVFNLGVWGYGTIQEVKVFHLFEDYKPDLVILEFYARDAYVEEAGNDLVDNYNFRLSEQARKSSDRKARQQMSSFRSHRRIKEFIAFHCNLCRLAALELGAVFKQNYHPTGNEELKQKAWQITEDALRDFDRDLEAMNIKCLLIWVAPPGTVAAGDDAVADKLTSFHFHNIVILDPLSAFHADPKRYFYSLDTHWRPAGHELAAALLTHTILDKHLLQ